MSKSATRLNRASVELFLFVSILFILLLSSINIKSFLAPRLVLGVATEKKDDSTFWKDFLDKNPDYIPGWVEIGRQDKVKEIDPNYF